jgi:hypothetical protein
MNNPDFAGSLFAGLRTGSAIADMFEQRRKRTALQELAELAKQGDYNGLGGGLVALGEVGAGVNALGVPYQRDQNELDRAFRRDQFAFQQQQATGDDAFRQRQFDAEQAYRQQQMQLAREKLQAEMDGSAETFTTPVQAQDAQGNPVYLQAGNRGSVRPLQGFSPLNPIKTVDLGTEIVTVDSRTNQVLDRKPKANFDASYDKAAGAEAGKTRAEREASAPSDINAADDALGLIEQVKTHPGIDYGTGMEAPIATRIPGTPAYDFANLVNQVKSGAFLTAIQQMRGMGALSNAEGQTATAAVTRMDTATSKQAFLKAVADYEAIIRRARAKAEIISKSRMTRGQVDATLPVQDRQTLGYGTQQTVRPVPEDDDAAINALIDKYGN